MNRRSVLFLPENITIEVEPGTSVLAAASLASIEVKSPCGGDGTCGKCAIILRKGVPALHSTSQLREAGRSLACQTFVGDEDLVVEIPKAARLNEHQVLIDNQVIGEQHSELLAELLELQGHSFQPLCRKVQLALPVPSLQDNRDDCSRLLLALNKKTSCSDITVSLPVMRELGEALRAGNFTVTVILAEFDGRAEVLGIEPGCCPRPIYGLAVDIGTTTVVAYLVDLERGKIVETAGTHNSQARFGDDVISRIVHTAEEEDGLQQVHQAVIDTVNCLALAMLEKRHDIRETDIRVVMTAGNTTMAHLFLGIPPKYIRLEPYIPTANLFPGATGRELGLRVNPDAKVFSFPAVASYVGGDIVAGALVTGLGKEAEGMSLLIDIGTNGEIALGMGESLVTCSCSAGPAFEGSGISFGMRAMHGAIERVSIEPDTYMVHYSVIAGVKPVGICGSGLIDCLAKMRKAGVIDRAGSIQTHLTTSRVRLGKTGPEFVLAWQEETELDCDIVVTEADVKNLLRAKGAVFAGIRTLLQIMGLSVEEIERIYVAGGFGNYLNIQDAVAIGLLPDLPPEKYQFIGNSSIKGACTAMLSQQAWKEARELAGKMTYIELSAGNLFMEEFISALFIPHTDLRLFPSNKL